MLKLSLLYIQVTPVDFSTPFKFPDIVSNSKKFQMVSALHLLLCASVVFATPFARTAQLVRDSTEKGMFFCQTGFPGYELPLVPNIIASHSSNLSSSRPDVLVRRCGLVSLSSRHYSRYHY